MNPQLPDSFRYIILGAGGHAKVVVATLQSLGKQPLGCTTPHPSHSGAAVLGVPILGDDSILNDYDPNTTRLINGLGCLSASDTHRSELFKTWKNLGYSFATIVHASAINSPETTLAEGVHVMANAVIQPGCRIGENSIINTSASIDHDCTIGSHVHIAPGVVTSGNVTVGDHAFIGTGAIVIQGISIGAGAMVAAGAVVVADVAPKTIVRGVPAK
jgi:sugar O-acyltransferase (sialic acid O-acetyltransferase NeuD family)